MAVVVVPVLVPVADAPVLVPPVGAVGLICSCVVPSDTLSF